jgi:hypothetical protein
MVRIGQRMWNDLSGMKLEMGHHAQVIGVISDVAIYPALPSSPVELSPTSPRNSNSRLPSRVELHPALLGSLGLDSELVAPTGSGDGHDASRGKKIDENNEAISSPRHESLCRRKLPGQLWTHLRSGRIFIQYMLLQPTRHLITPVFEALVIGHREPVTPNDRALAVSVPGLTLGGESPGLGKRLRSTNAGLATSAMPRQSVGFSGLQLICRLPFDKQFLQFSHVRFFPFFFLASLSANTRPSAASRLCKCYQFAAGTLPRFGLPVWQLVGNVWPGREDDS